MSFAIAYFGSNGYTVNIPLNDTQWYDFVVEKDGVFKTVQCKATGSSDNCIMLRSTGGTNGRVYDHVFNHNLDYLFCLDVDKHIFLIPVEDLKKNGVGDSIALRPNGYSKNAHPRIDTSKYLVEL